MPDHSFINPLKLKYLLGYLVVVGVMRDDAGRLRFQYRLIGMELVDRWCKDFTGLWMHEHNDPEVAAKDPPSCQLSVETRGPVLLQAKRMIDGNLIPLSI